MGITSLLGSNLPFTSREVSDVDCTWFERLNLLDLEGYPFCIASLVGSNLVNKLWCIRNFEGLIVSWLSPLFLN
jgi:hypothetical protein